MLAFRLSIVPVLAGVLLLLGPGAAPAQESCRDALDDFERTAKVVEVSPRVGQQIREQWQTARDQCAEGDVDAARDTLNAAWAALLDDTELVVPAVEQLAQADPCTQGIQAVQERLGTATVSDMTHDAAATLIELADGLCEEDRPMDAQGKLAMAWSMLEQQ